MFGFVLLYIQLCVDTCVYQSFYSLFTFSPLLFSPQDLPLSMESSSIHILNSTFVCRGKKTLIECVCA